MKKTLRTGLTILLLSFGFWSALWVFGAGAIRKQAESFIADSKSNGILIVTRSLSVGNYPFTPEIAFSGRISAYGRTIDAPRLLVRSFFLTGWPLRIEAPEGLSVLEPADATLLSADRVTLAITIPSSLPAAATHEDMQAWKDSGGAVDLKRIEMEKGPLRLEGSGRLALDDALQPSGAMAVRTAGHLPFLEWLRENSYVNTKEALLAGAVLAGLSKPDPETGEFCMDTSLTIQNRMLFAGPLRLFELPPILWPWRR